MGVARYEHTLPESSRGIMAEAAIRLCEIVLADLLMAVSDEMDAFKAALVARGISAAIISYLEKPILCQYMERDMNVDFSDKEKVQQYLHEFLMQSLEFSLNHK